MSLLRSEQCFWLVVLRGKFASANQKHYWDLRSDTSSVWNFSARSWAHFIWKLVACLRNVGCFLRLHFPFSYCFHHVLKVIGLRWQVWAWNNVILSYFFPLQRSGGFLPNVSTNVVLRAYLRLNKRRSNSIQWKSRRSSTVLRNSHHYFSNVLLFRGSQSSGTVSSQNCKLSSTFDSKSRKH